VKKDIDIRERQRDPRADQRYFGVGAIATIADIVKQSKRGASGSRVVSARGLQTDRAWDHVEAASRPTASGT
jgi:hypothetical protein